MLTAFIFPGQGSQSVGMGQEIINTFPIAKQTMEEADEILGQKITSLILGGPESELTLTENTQPALLALSVATLRTIKLESGKSLTDLAFYCAGHSLGEYTALCAAGVLTFSQALKLVKLRGQAMQRAVPAGVGSMAAVIGLDNAIIDKVLEDFNDLNNLCVVANDNSPGQTVISGHRQAVEQASGILTRTGAKRVIPLSVSAPFHSPLMQPAAAVMQSALEEITVAKPIISVVSNVTADLIVDYKELPNLLATQMVSKVRWQESIQRLVNLGCQQFVEIGSGKVLTGLNKRIAPSAKSCAINIPADLDSFLKNLP